MQNTVTLLVGPQGSGKSTYCREHLADHLRISQDDQGRQAHHLLFEEAVTRSEPRIVVDRINGIKSQRKRYLEFAKKHGYRTRIVWLNADRAVCLKRCRERVDHPTLSAEEADKALQLYFNSFQIPSRMEADELTILGPAPRFVPVRDLCEAIGSRRHIIVGDIHGCYEELRDLLTQVAFDPANDVLISCGDIVDRGPKVRETVEFLFGLPNFYMVLGNHEEKFVRYLEGNNIKIAHGLQETIDSFAGVFPPDLRERLKALPVIVKTPSGYVVHAGFDPEMPPEEQSFSDCIYMRYYGGKTYFDAINGRPWYTLWPRDQPRVFFGHIPMADGPIGQAVSLDAGCVFGGEMKAFDSRDGKIHAVKARQAYAASDNALHAAASPGDAAQKREAYVAQGLLRSDRTDDDRLAIYTYTDQCVYDSAWDDITRNCRGHVYDLLTGACAAYAFPKFFNLGENKENLPECFPWHEPYEIYEKMDGWLGVLYRHDGQYHVASRGSFHSSGAVWATQYIRTRDLSCLPDEATLCFEIIHPEHKIILDYDNQSTLVILAAYNRVTGVEYPRTLVAEWARRIDVPIVPILAHMSLEELLHSQKNRENFEGFVLRFSDGRRVKVKTEWYMQMARIMSNLNPIAIWEVMLHGKVRHDYLVQVPEELRPIAERYQAILEGQYARVLDEIDRVAAPILREFGDNRKSLALHLKERSEELGYIKPAIFLLLDGKRDQLEKIIMARIYPHANQFVEETGVQIIPER